MQSENDAKLNKVHSDPLDMMQLPEFRSESFRYGRLWVFGRNEFGQYKFVIGPHWYYSLIGLTLIILLGGLILIPIWKVLGPIFKVLYITFWTLTIFVYLLIFLSNPGIIPQKSGRDLNEDVENKNQYSCLKCMALKVQRAYHCEDCDVCIDNFDHHCIWVGKCIGGKNLRLFYIFIATVPSFFMFVMFMSSFLSMQIERNAKQ